MAAKRKTASKTKKPVTKKTGKSKPAKNAAKAKKPVKKTVKKTKAKKSAPVQKRAAKRKPKRVRPATFEQLVPSGEPLFVTPMEKL